MESYSPRNAAWERYLEYQKGIPQHGIFMLFASTWSVLDDFTAHSEEQDHKQWQHLQGSLGEFKAHLSMNQEHCAPQFPCSLRRSIPKEMLWVYFP